MESSLYLLVASSLALSVIVVKLLFSWWVFPYWAYRKMKANGFSGPKPIFPFGNLKDMRRIKKMYSNSPSPSSSLGISNDILPTVFPHFAWWQKFYGKVFVYWLGTEPFLYIADPEYVKQVTPYINGKYSGKPNVFKRDRQPMIGSGLVLVDGDDWVLHRHLITPAFSPLNLKGKVSLMVESGTNMVDRWAALIKSGQPEIDVHTEITNTTGDVIAKTSFGVCFEDCRQVFDKIKELQTTLFKSNRLVGLPFLKIFNPRHTLRAKALGKDIDRLVNSIIIERRRNRLPEKDFVGLLMEGNTVDGRKKRALTTQEMLDECKTFLFGGRETTALALMWTLRLLSIHPKWQGELREEIKQVVGDPHNIDATILAGLKKMGWVMSEVIRLYPSVPSILRQARQDIQVGKQVIPNGTNMWIDIISMHHDKELWGKDANEFKPERFDNNIYGKCNHKMGYLPFGFGGRMCIGWNMAVMEYKVLLTLILSSFSFSLSPNYCHEPSVLLSLRPMHGMSIIFKPL